MAFRNAIQNLKPGETSEPFETDNGMHLLKLVEVKQSEVHGMAKRGGSVFSHVRFGPRVWSPTIPKGEADILVAAVGVRSLIGPEYVAEGAVVVDVGMHRVTDRETVERLYPDSPKKLAAFDKRGAVLAGDVDFTAVAPKAGRITPVPGGVGPLTIAMLMANTVKAARARRGL